MTLWKSTLAIVIITVLACTDHKTLQPTKSQLLTNGSWYVMKWLYTDGSSPTIDLMTSESPWLPLCRKDDYFTFSNDGRFTQSKGTSECDQDPYYIPASMVKGGWKLSDDQQKLTFTYNGQSLKFFADGFHSYYFFPPECTIQQLDESTFIMQGSADQNADDRPDTSVYIFRKK